MSKQFCSYHGTYDLCHDQQAYHQRVMEQHRTAETVSSAAVWLLDIDGVVNTFCSPEKHPWAEQGLTHTQVSGLNWIKPFKFQFSPVLVSRIFELADKHSVDVRLASAWNCDPDGIFEHVLQREIPLAFDASGPWDALGKKVGAAEDIAQTGCRVIWTDDDAIPHGFNNRYRNVWTARPREDYGLTPEDLTQIEMFLAQATAGERVGAQH